MLRYSGQQRLLLAADCIIFGFDGKDIKLLLIQRGFRPSLGKWSLMGGFVGAEESAEEAANRILKQLTDLEGVYMEQLHTFSSPERDPVERTRSEEHTSELQSLMRISYAVFYLIKQKTKNIQ